LHLGIKIDQKLGRVTNDQAKEMIRAIKKAMSYPKGDARGLIEATASTS